MHRRRIARSRRRRRGPGRSCATAPDPVNEALAAVRREWFLPPGQVALARFDQPLPIGHGQTNSQPTTVRHCLEQLDVRPGHKVLDVGCGSCWTTALLARLVGPTGDVTGVEVIPALVAFGRANLAPLDLPWTRVEQALPEVIGWPMGAPYDRILVSAEADVVPDELVAQLGSRGRMVIPVAGRLTVVQRSDEAKEGVWIRQLGHYRFVPLRGPRRNPPG